MTEIDGCADGAHAPLGVGIWPGREELVSGSAIVRHHTYRALRAHGWTTRPLNQHPSPRRSEPKRLQVLQQWLAQHPSTLRKRSLTTRYDRIALFCGYCGSIAQDWVSYWGLIALIVSGGRSW
jgi:hypothetical protein